MEGRSPRRLEDRGTRSHPEVPSARLPCKVTAAQNTFSNTNTPVRSNCPCAPPAPPPPRVARAPSFLMFSLFSRLQFVLTFWSPLMSLRKRRLNGTHVSQWFLPKEGLLHSFLIVMWLTLQVFFRFYSPKLHWLYFPCVSLIYRLLGSTCWHSRPSAWPCSPPFLGFPNVRWLSRSPIPPASEDSGQTRLLHALCLHSLATSVSAPLAADAHAFLSPGLFSWSFSARCSLKSVFALFLLPLSFWSHSISPACPRIFVILI